MNPQQVKKSNPPNMVISRDNETMLQAINEANKALMEGNRRAARRWAEQAVFLARDKEESWLCLAQNSSPRASVAYLEEALKINPISLPAKAAMDWALHRLNAQPNNKMDAPGKAVHVNRSDNLHEARLRASILGVLAVCALVVTIIFWFSWYGSFPKVYALISRNIKTQTTSTGSKINPPMAAAKVLLATSTTAPRKTETLASSLTPTLISTLTPAPTNTSSPTPIPTHLPSWTATFTPPPTATPPTQTVYIVQRGDTLSQIAAKFSYTINDLIRVNNITNPAYIKTGQKLIIPKKGFTAAASPMNPAAPVPTAGKLIVVNISSQHVYAYEGEKLVFSFVASTGQNNSTLAGNYSILDKMPDAYSDPWGFWMPDWMGIYYVGNDLENGFHSLPVLSNGAQLWGSLIGVPITYGCIVLRPEDMKQLYNWADIGTAVEIR